jgi:hypothetical protein
MDVRLAVADHDQLSLPQEITHRGLDLCNARDLSGTRDLREREHVLTALA